MGKMKEAMEYAAKLDQECAGLPQNFTIEIEADRTYLRSVAFDGASLTPVWTKNLAEAMVSDKISATELCEALKKKKYPVRVFEKS